MARATSRPAVECNSFRYLRSPGVPATGECSTSILSERVQFHNRGLEGALLLWETRHERQCHLPPLMQRGIHCRRRLIYISRETVELPPQSISVSERCSTEIRSLRSELSRQATHVRPLTGRDLVRSNGASKRRKNKVLILPGKSQKMNALRLGPDAAVRSLQCRPLIFRSLPQLLCSPRRISQHCIPANKSMPTATAKFEMLSTCSDESWPAPFTSAFTWIHGA